MRTVQLAEAIGCEYLQPLVPSKEHTLPFLPVSSCFEVVRLTKTLGAGLHGEGQSLFLLVFSIENLTNVIVFGARLRSASKGGANLMGIGGYHSSPYHRSSKRDDGNNGTQW